MHIDLYIIQLRYVTVYVSTRDLTGSQVEFKAHIQVCLKYRYCFIFQVAFASLTLAIVRPYLPYHVRTKMSENIYAYALR